ncbi:MAG: alpha-glucan family phosphorylase [Clostridiales bacterium]|nr:alpha-glucan family phosphorylase [Clostridiales bacterium]
MSDTLLTSKKVLAVCMETTAGGRNYSGGLGALYGDTTRTMHRLGASFVAFTPIYKNGYVRQTLTDNGVIDEYPEQDLTIDYEDTGKIIEIPMLWRTIKVKLWKHKTIDIAYGLDSNVPENGELAAITNNLYGENGIGIYDGEAQRLFQEVIVGAGAVIAAKELGYDFEILHLNEGHGIFAAIYMISKLKEAGHSFTEALMLVRRQTVFTTHTPISVGNKSRPIQMILDLGVNFGLSYDELKTIGGDSTGTMLGSTTAALRMSKIANAVALRHQSTSQDLWKWVEGRCPITYIDNGVDIEYWQSKAIKYAYESNDLESLINAHRCEKANLIDEVMARNGIQLDINKPIIGFARRVIAYKRADLIFEDIARFERLINEHGIQIIFSGKTHPKDYNSKDILMKLYHMSKRYPQNVVFLQNYDVTVAGLMTKGCDIWLGNPEIPLEACSTSGMKAAANGVINLSTADGWWFRSCRFAVNGWTIGESYSHDKYTDAQFLYKILEEKVLPTYKTPYHWAKMMYAAIYTANEECSTDRMVRDYYAYLYNAPYIY